MQLKLEWFIVAERHQPCDADDGGSNNKFTQKKIKVFNLTNIELKPRRERERGDGTDPI